MRFGFKHALVFDLDILLLVPFVIAVCVSYIDTIVVGTEWHVQNSFIARICRGGGLLVTTIFVLLPLVFKQHCP